MNNLIKIPNLNEYRWEIKWFNLAENEWQTIEYSKTLQNATKIQLRLMDEMKTDFICVVQRGNK